MDSLYLYAYLTNRNYLAYLPILWLWILIPLKEILNEGDGIGLAEKVKVLRKCRSYSLLVG